MKHLRALVCTVMLLSVAACGLGGGSGGQALAAPDFSGGAEFSRTKSYGTQEELLNDATLVVTVVPTGNVSVEEVGRTPFDVVEMKVQETHKGVASPESLIYVRLGAFTYDEKNEPHQVLTTDTAFLLYLTPFELEVGKPTDQWVVVGYLAGMYMDLDTRALGDSFAKIDPESPGLPDAVTKDDLSKISQ